MANILLKGREYNTISVKDSFNRRALQYKNALIDKFKKLGVGEDDFDISEQAVAFRKTTAYVSWYIDGRHMYFSYSQCAKYVENLYVVLKVLEKEIDALLSDEQTPSDFLDKFAEHHDVAEARKEARLTLGVAENTTDINIINTAYKELAKEHHPDKEGGNTETFKKINNAHKLLKRELT